MQEGAVTEVMRLLVSLSIEPRLSGVTLNLILN